VNFKLRGPRRLVAGTLCAAALILTSLSVPAGSLAWEPPTELPYREIVEPTGGRAPLGAMLVIHGGGWLGGPDLLEWSRPLADFYAQQGWLVWDIDYRSSENAYGDVQMWFEMLDAQVDLPLCASGWSAGGHLALLLAAHEHLDCVISEGGPTDLTGLSDSLIEQSVVPAFGEALWENSPLRFATEQPEAYAGTDILLGHAAEDPLVPVEQVREFAAALPDQTNLDVLDPGPVGFVHASVDAAEDDGYWQAQAQLLDRTGRPEPQATPPDAPVTAPDALGTPPDAPLTPPDAPVTPPDAPVTPPDAEPSGQAPEQSSQPPRPAQSARVSPPAHSKRCHRRRPARCRHRRPLQRAR
jgi:dienelactone hydrolase